MPPPRAQAVLTDDEQKKAAQDLITARDRQSNYASTHSDQ